MYYSWRWEEHKRKASAALPIGEKYGMQMDAIGGQLIRVCWAVKMINDGLFLNCPQRVIKPYWKLVSELK